jgi:hypothetical protein
MRWVAEEETERGLYDPRDPGRRDLLDDALLHVLDRGEDGLEADDDALQVLVLNPRCSQVGPPWTPGSITASGGGFCHSCR